MAEESDDKTAFQVERLAFFSDAVFAIAITLLALNIQPPAISGEVTELVLQNALLRMLPHVIGFVLSFMVIGIYWRAHHRLFRWVRRYNEKLVGINMTLLLCVSFIPCPTAFYSEYFAAQTPLVFYCGSLALVGLVNFRLYRYLRSHPELLDPATPMVEFKVASHRSLIVPVLFIVAAAVSFASPILARTVMILVPFAIPLYTRLLRRRHELRANAS